MMQSGAARRHDDAAISQKSANLSLSLSLARSLSLFSYGICRPLHEMRDLEPWNINHSLTTSAQSEVKIPIRALNDPTIPSPVSAVHGFPFTGLPLYAEEGKREEDEI